MSFENANFIPLGGDGPVPKRSRTAPTTLSGGGPKVIGETKEEYKRIAREIRLAAKKAHKKDKADAKKARKLNGILHRRATKNPEKYRKNLDRNRQRGIDLERQKIQFGAVHQCERLAGIHDTTGKMFNVGEVIVTEEGKIRSKEAIRREAEREAQKQAEKEAEAITPRNRKISKNQLKRQEMLKPKPIPPKPVIPEGIELPKGEENLVALWDITDQEIESRLKRQKANKRAAGKQLRKIQKEQKKLNRAMKLRKKQCAYAGVTWDPERAKKEIMAQMTAEDDEDDSDSESGSDSSDNESDVEEATNGDTPKKKKLPPLQKPKLDLNLIAQAEQLAKDRAEKKLAAKRKRREDRKKAEEEAKAKKAEEVKQAEAAAALEKAAKKAEKKRKRAQDDDEEPEQEEEKEKSHKKKKKVKAEEIEADVANGDVMVESEEPEKKKKKSKNEKIESIDEGDVPSESEKKKKKSKKDKVEVIEPDDSPVEAEEPERKKSKKRDRATTEATEEEPIKSESKKKRKVKESNDDKLDRQIAEQEAKHNEATNGHGAAQWNPDALLGDAERKDKFLRLLGAGKNGIEKSDGKKEKKSKDKNSVDEISKVQSELERQYEAGMKHKHDGGSKRRGLGA